MSHLSRPELARYREDRRRIEDYFRVEAHARRLNWEEEEAEKRLRHYNQKFHEELEYRLYEDYDPQKKELEKQFQDYKRSKMFGELTK